MKQIFTLILGYFLLSTWASAQYTDSLWLVESHATKVRSMAIFETQFNTDIRPNISQSDDNQYSLSWENDSVYAITYTKANGEVNWASVNFSTISWEGSAGEKFTHNAQGEPIEHDIAKGYIVDISPTTKRQVQFQIQATHDITFLGTLKDVQGKVSNAVEAKVTVNATVGGVDITDESKWVTVTMSWNPQTHGDGDYGSLLDGWSDFWWNRSNANMRETEQPLDSSSVCGFQLLADPSGFYTADVEKTFYIKNLIIGKEDIDNLWQVQDQTQHVTSELLISPLRNFDISKLGPATQYNYNFTNNILSIDFTNTSYPNNNEPINITLTTPIETDKNYFVTDLTGVAQQHDTIFGTSVNMSTADNRLIRFQIQASGDLYIAANLIDINGKISNGKSPKVHISATSSINTEDETKWQTITLAWDKMITSDASVDSIFDAYSLSWLNTDVSSVRNPLHALDTTRIVGVQLIIDGENLGTLQANKQLYIRKLSIGKRVTYPIPDISLTYEDTKQSCNLSDYYYGSGIINYTATSQNENNVSTKIATPVMFVTAENACENYTELVTAQFNDAEGTHEESYNVDYTKHTITNQGIGIVSFDNTNETISVMWERNNYPHLASYNIYKEDSPNNFTLLSNHPQNTTSEYVDISANNNVAHSYKISAVDICGEESELSDKHTTILLEKNDANLSWSKYIGQTVLAYQVLGGNTFSNMKIIGEVSPIKTTYKLTNIEYTKYVIKAVLDTSINPTELKSFDFPVNYSCSNAVAYPVSVNNVNNTVAVYPNPCIDYIQIDTKNEIKKVELTDLIGNKYSTEVKNGIVDLSTFSSGIYLFEILFTDGSIYTCRIMKE